MTKAFVMVLFSLEACVLGSQTTPATTSSVTTVSATSGGSSAGATSPSAPSATTSGDGGGAPPSGGGPPSGGNPPVIGTPPPPDPCVAAGNCASGVWVNVTGTLPLSGGTPGGCTNFGMESVQMDPAYPNEIYTLAMCTGIYKSTDYGLTWNGPIDTGANHDKISDCQGGITLSAETHPPTLYESCIQGSGKGFWKSTNGGVDFTPYNVAAATSDRQDMYPPVIDPHNSQHLLMAGHEQNVLAESTDGGQSWASVHTEAGMTMSGGTAAILFVDNGSDAHIWLWQSTDTGGAIGTWRSTNGGASWNQVSPDEHTHGGLQIYQPNFGGTIYMPGVRAATWGVLVSTDYGATWAHSGTGTNVAESAVFATSKRIYSTYSYPGGAGLTYNPNLQSAPIADTGVGTWSAGTTPAEMTDGPIQAVVTNNQTNNVIVTANFNGGLWRYVEP